MKSFSNRYIVFYAALMTVVVAVVLSIVAATLKSRQETNIRNEKMLSLLASIDVNATSQQADACYRKYFRQEMTVGTDGNIISRYDVATADEHQPDRAFNINLKEQQKVESDGGHGAFPIYIYEKAGRRGYVIPTQGKGLWGAIYANIALAEDLNTIVGITFRHDGETPGLGAEIVTEKFQKPFIGKQILDDAGQVISVKVCKHANAASAHEVDAISGGTMTSNGVSEMLADDLHRYQQFITNQRKEVSHE